MSQTEPANIYLWVGGYTGGTGPNTGWTNGGIASSGWWVNWADGSTTDKGDFSYSPYCWNYPENWVIWNMPESLIGDVGIYPGFSRARTIPGCRDRAIFDANVSGIIKDLTLYADTRTGIRSDIAVEWKTKFNSKYNDFALTPIDYVSQPNSTSPGGLFVPYAFPYRISCLFGGVSGDGYTHSNSNNLGHYLTSKTLITQRMNLMGGVSGLDPNIDTIMFAEGVHDFKSFGASEMKYHYFPENPTSDDTIGNSKDSKFDGRGNKNAFYAPLESVRIGYAYRKNGIGAGSNLPSQYSSIFNTMIPLPKSGWAGVGLGGAPITFPSAFNRSACAINKIVYPGTPFPGHTAPPGWPGFQGNGGPIPSNLPRSSSCGPKVYPNGVPGWAKPGATLGSGVDMIQFVTPDLPKHPLGFRQGEIGVPLPKNYNKDWNMTTGWNNLNSTGGDYEGRLGVEFEGTTAQFYQNSKSWFKTHIPGVPLRLRTDSVIINDHAWRNGLTSNTLDDGANVNIHGLPIDYRYLGGTAGTNSTVWRTNNIVGASFVSTSNFATCILKPSWWQWTTWGMLGGAGPYSSVNTAPVEGQASDWFALQSLYSPMSIVTSLFYSNTNKCDVLPPFAELGGPSGPWLSPGSHQILLSGYWGQIHHKSGYLSVVGATASVATGLSSNYTKNYNSGIRINSSPFIDGFPDSQDNEYDSLLEGFARDWFTKRHLFFYYPYFDKGMTASLIEPKLTNSPRGVLQDLGLPANCVGAFISNTNFGHLNIGVQDFYQVSPITAKLRSKLHRIKDGVKILDGCRTFYSQDSNVVVEPLNPLEIVSTDGIQVSGWETQSPSNCLMIGTFDTNYGSKPVYAKHLSLIPSNLNMTAQSENENENISLNMKYNMGPIVRMGGNLYVEEIRANGGYVGVHPDANGPISIIDGYAEGPTLLDLNYKSNKSQSGLTFNDNVLILGNSTTEGTGIKIINTNIPSNWIYDGIGNQPVLNSTDENVSIYGYGQIVCDSDRLAQGKIRIIPDSYNAYRIRDEITGATAAAYYRDPI
jgi:hypothetical protein